MDRSSEINSEIIKKVEFIVKNDRCPICDKDSLSVCQILLDIPYFGETVKIITSCSSCGWKHLDVSIASSREGCIYEVLISKPEDMNIRVVRSSTASIYLPELEISIEPGPYAEGYITNIEGVLERIKDVLLYLLRDAESESDKLKIYRKLEEIEMLKTGRISSRFILEDPRGSSIVVGENVIKRPLNNSQKNFITSI